jgi:hypothetical protein
MHIKLKNRLWTTVALLHCCNLNGGLANDNYSHLLSSVFDWQWQFMFVLYFHSEAIYSWTIEQIDRDIVLLLKITQTWIITICVVFDYSTVIFISKGKGGGGYKKFLVHVCKTQIVKVDRNKNVTLNSPRGSYELKKNQNKSVQTAF